MIDTPDLMGWIACLLTFLAFSMKDIIPLRMAALGANIAFIGWGFAAGLVPILALHCALLPCNLFRLTEAILDRRKNRNSATRDRMQPPQRARPDPGPPNSPRPFAAPENIDAIRTHGLQTLPPMPGLAYFPLPPGRTVATIVPGLPHQPRPAADLVPLRPGPCI